MGLLPDIGYPQTGDKSGAGTYICMNCPHEDSDDKSVAILNKKIFFRNVLFVVIPTG